MANIKIVLHRIIFCSTYRQNTHSQRRPKQSTMTSGSGSSWAWSRMGLLSSRELGLLPLMIAPCPIFVMGQGGKRPHSEWLGHSLSNRGVSPILNSKRKNKLCRNRAPSVVMDMDCVVNDSRCTERKVKVYCIIFAARRRISSPSKHGQR